ncbi:MAG: transglutaminase-like domain-containing protein [Thermoproteota archaeon]|nr:transglutaminase-like domain-containing protein [Thermoproteota archaeon]
MHGKVSAAFTLMLCLSLTIFTPTDMVNAANGLENIQLFDSKMLHVHGYIVYRYNSNTSAANVEVGIPLWAPNFWSEITLLKTSCENAKLIGTGSGFEKYNATKDDYDLAGEGDPDAIYVAGFKFEELKPYQMVTVHFWFKLSISKVDMSGMLPKYVGTVSEAKNVSEEALGGPYQKYVNETYYWDYNNSTVQKVINEINATLSGGKNIYEIVYATINWFSHNMTYREHSDYPSGRLRASQIFNETTSDGKYYGVCRHFADAFTAIMRGFGVPSKMGQGLVFYDMGGDVGVVFSGGHAWCEVYMPNVGWVPVEVTISDKYMRDIVRVGLISEYYYLPQYVEFAHSGPEKEDGEGEKKPYENLVGAYWNWKVGEVPIGTVEGIMQYILSIPIMDWVLLALVVALAVDVYLLRKKIEAITQW